MQTDRIVEALLAKGLIRPEQSEQIRSVVAQELGENVADTRQRLEQMIFPASKKDMEQSETPAESSDNVIDDIIQNGRFAISACHSAKVSKDRTNRNGNHTIADRRQQSSILTSRLTTLRSFVFGNEFLGAKNRSGIRAAVGMYSLPNEKIGKYIADVKQPDERAFLIMFTAEEIHGERNSEEWYRQPDTKRNGGQFVGCIVLPEQRARSTFAQIQRDPGIIWKIFRKAEPDIMGEQEAVMPKTLDRIFIIPEGDPRDAYEGKTISEKRMRSDCIHAFPARSGSTYESMV